MSAIVIIGAGHAAGQAAASLRQEGYEGELVMLGEESHVPYQRPPLSKQYLAGDQVLEDLYIRPAAFFEKQNIDLRTGVRATRIDAQAKTVTSDQGETLAFEKLLLATGSRPRVLQVPGADLAGVHYLRTANDVDAIRAAMPQAKRLCIVGGGYIGLEVASVAATAGLQVTVLEMEPRILQRVTTPQISEFYQRLHSGHGVQIRVDTQVTAFEGEHNVSAVLCADQRIQTDLVIVGIGIVPNVELADEAALACHNGIVVDEQCRTSDPDIFAAGDCTNHPNPILGRRLRLESVPNAMEQARVAANAILGGDKTYASAPWFWSDQYDLKLQMVGFSADGDQQVVRGDVQGQAFAVFHLKDNTLVAADAVNSPREFMMARKLFGKIVDPVALGDPEVELKSLLS